MYGISNACPLPPQATQEQMFWRSFANLNSQYQQAAWMCGFIGNNENPLSKDEVMQIANSTKSYSWAFKDINKRLKKRRSQFTPLRIDRSNPRSFIHLGETI